MNAYACRESDDAEYVVYVAAPTARSALRFARMVFSDYNPFATDREILLSSRVKLLNDQEWYLGYAAPGKLERGEVHSFHVPACSHCCEGNYVAPHSKLCPSCDEYINEEDQE